MKIEVKACENLNKVFEAVKPGDEVVLEKGVYEICDTINIPSGVKIIGNGATVKGSKKIPVSGKGLVEIDLKEAGITDYGKFGEGPYEDYWNDDVSVPKPYLTDFGPGLELFYDGGLMNLSRYPENGFIKITEALGETPKMFKGERNGSMEGIIRCSDDSISSFVNPEELLLVGYWSADWATQRHTIKSLKDGVIEVNEPYHTFGYRDGTCFSGEIGGKFYVLNAKEAVNAPGKWCINRAEGKLYVYLYPGQDYIEVSVADDCFCIYDAEGVSVSDLEIVQCRKSGIYANNCKDITVENCCIKYTGAWGVLGEGCTGMTVSKCHIEQTAGGGIGVEGGDRVTLTPSGNLVFGCTITEVARWHKTYMAGIDLRGVGATASENKIYEVPHFGILYGGNEHIIEKNDIGNACYESNDAGAIYSGRDYTYRGQIIRNNYIHDMYGYEGRGCIGLYFDDAVSNAEVYGNIFANIPYIGLLLAGGRDFNIHDNTFFNCKMAIMYDRRASRWKQYVSGDNSMTRLLDKSPYRTDIWKERYPELYSIRENDMQLPKGNKICNNHTIGGDGFCLEDESIEKLTVMEGNTFAHEVDPGEHEINHYNWYYING